MEIRVRPHLGPRLVLGLIIVFVGVVIFLDNLHYVEGKELFRWWPALLIVLGVAKLLDPGSVGRRFGALIWILAGALLLALNLHIVPARIKDFWPLLLVLLGGWIALRGFGAWGPRAPAADQSAVTNDFAFMSGLTRKNSSKEFRGGEATAIMGGEELDLRDASIAGGEAVLDLFAMWGGIDIIVPGDWTVDNKVTPILGGVEDSRKTVGADPTKRLVLRGLAIMGGIEITN